MTLGGIAPYFGSKREMAPQIVAHFGKHDQYFEVFAGSLAVLFAKEPCRHEIVSEKNPDVANLIRCLSDERAAKTIWEAVSVKIPSERCFADAVQQMASDEEDPDFWACRYPDYAATGFAGHCDTLDMRRAVNFLLVSWQGPSGLAGTTRKPRFAVRNTTSGGTVVARWKAVADSIPEWHERLRNVEFRCRDAFELIAACPDREGAVLYADSPYHSESRTGGDYVFDFDEPMVVDGKERCPHEYLAECLGRFKKTKVVVSHYSGPVIDGLYAGWRKVPIEAPRKLKHATGGTHERVEAGEVVFINRE